MGLFDKLAELGEQLNQADNDISKTTITDYGEPVYSLYTARDLTDIHWRINVTDEQEQLKYYTKSSFFQLKGETDIMDAEDKVIAHLEKKPFSLHEIHYVQMANAQEITLSNELFHIVDDITNIEELGWQMRGNFISLHFNLVDQNEQPLATVSRKMVSLHDKYCIGIYQPQYEDVIVAIVIQLEKMLEDRRQNQSSSDD